MLIELNTDLNELHTVTVQTGSLFLKADGIGIVNILTIPKSGMYLILANPDLNVDVKALMVTQFTVNGITTYKSFRQNGEGGGGSINAMLRSLSTGDVLGMRCVNTSSVNVTFNVSIQALLL